MKVVFGNQLSLIPASHEDPTRPGVLKKILAMRDDFVAGQVQMLNWSVCPRGSSFRRHYHEDMQEIFVILSGFVVMEAHGDTAGPGPVNSQSVRLGAGDLAIIEPREAHKMTNVGDTDVTYIVFGIAMGQNGKTVVVEE